MQRIVTQLKSEAVDDSKVMPADQDNKLQILQEDKPYDYSLAPAELNDKIVDLQKSKKALIENMTKPFTFFLCMFLPRLLMQQALQPNSYMASLFSFVQRRNADELVSSVISLREKEFTTKEEAVKYTRDLAEYLYPGIEPKEVDLIQYGYIHCVTERAEFFDTHNFTAEDNLRLKSIKEFFVNAYTRLLQVLAPEQRGSEVSDYFVMTEERVLGKPIDNYVLFTGTPKINFDLLQKKSFIELSRLINNKYTLINELLTNYKSNPAAIPLLAIQDINQVTFHSTKQNLNVGFSIFASISDYVVGRIISVLIRKLATYGDRVLKTPTVTQAEKIIESMEAKNVFLQKKYGYSAWFTAAMIALSLLHAISKYINNEIEDPALYIVLMSNIFTSISEMIYFHKMHQEKLNEIFLYNELSNNLACFNEAVSATQTKWAVDKHAKITNSEFIFSADQKKNRLPNKVNEIVKKVFFNNGIELEKKPTKSFKVSAFQHIDEADIINDQISYKLKKLNNPQKPDRDTRDSTSMTLTQLRNARRKHGLTSVNKPNYATGDKKEPEVIISPDIKGKLIRRKKSLMFILLTDKNPDLTQRDLDALPDKPARVHHQKGVKRLVKGDKHPFWIKNWSNKRIPLDKTESITGLVDGVEKKIPTYMACKTVKKQLG